MKTISTRILAIPLALALLLGGCTVDDPDSPTDLQTPTGTQVFKNYVAVGNSLTAGFMDGGLMMAGQAASVPKLVAGRIGFGGFTQPLIAAPGIGGIDPTTGNVTGVLYFTGTGVDVLGSTPLSAVEGLLLARAQPEPYHNLAVPGATTADMFGTVASATNPFFTFINRVSLYGNLTPEVTVFDVDANGFPSQDPRQATYNTASLGWQAVAKGPTLVTFWAGANDVLGWATRGGTQSPVPITSHEEFGRAYFAALQLLAGGLVERTGFPPTIVVGNLPHIPSAPYFMPRVTVFEPLAAGATGGAWTSGFAEADPVLVRYPALSWLANGDADNGHTPPDLASDPIPANYTLTQAEVDEANQAVDDFNTIIGQCAVAVTGSGQATVVVVDINTLMADIAAGTSEYGPYAGQHFLALALNPLTADRALETLFSLDGLHPNNRGNGVVANVFLEAIAGATDTELPLVDVDALVWDPTYADYQPAPEPAKAGALLSAAAGRALETMPR